MNSAIEQFRDFAAGCGYELPQHIEPGRFVRFGTNGKRGDDSGYAKLFPDLEGGIVGDFKSGRVETWQAGTGRAFTESETRAWRDKVGSAKKDAERKRQEQAAQAATKSQALWKAATPAKSDNPYLNRKGVSPVLTLREIDATAAAGILGYVPKSDHKPLAGRVLIAPVKIGDLISTCELIDEGGGKSAIAGGTKGGGYWAAQPLPEGNGEGLTVQYGEGVATTLSAKEANGHISIAALSAGNFEQVAQHFSERYPAARHVILADLVKETGEPDPRAIKAAQAICGLLAIPDFGADRPEGAKDFNDLASRCGAEAVKRAIEGASAPSAATPLPEAQTPVSGWPADLDEAAYHGLAGEIVQAIEPDTESDPAAIMLQVLVAFGALVGKGPHFPIEGDEHHSNLFALIVGQSSKARKGTSWGRVREIFSKAIDWPPVVDGLSSGEGLKYAVRDRVTKEEPDSKGFAKQVEIDPGVTDKRLLIVESEFAQVLRQVSRAGNTLSATIRSAWDSGNLRTLTKNDPVTATRAHICIVGHITDDELRAELTATDSANGFANRFLFMGAKRSKLLHFGGKPLPHAVVSDLAGRIAKAAGAAKTLGAVKMSADARSSWAATYEELSQGHPGLFGAVTGRAEAQCLRLALIYALMDERREIELPHLLAALAIWERAAASARYIFRDSLGDPIADEILRALRSAGSEGMTRTAISKLFGKHQTAERIGAALSKLSRQGKVRSYKSKTAGAPVETWAAA